MLVCPSMPAGSEQVASSADIGPSSDHLPVMSKAELLAEPPKLTPANLSEIQARIEDLAICGADGWREDRVEAPVKAAEDCRSP